jgi:MYXO-CTERM domain-containing protein
MKSPFVRSITIGLFSLVALAALAVPARATSVYQTGFESPTFAVGGLNGQDGWLAPAAATVQTSTVFAGAQAATFDANGVAGQSLAARFVAYDSAGNPEQRVDIRGEFFISAAGAGTNWDVAAVDGNAGFIGQLLIFNSSVAVLGLANTTVGSLPVSRGVWNDFDMVLDYSTGIQSAYINGTLVGQGVFATPSTTLNIYEFGVNSAAGTDALSLDNLSITASPAPLPSVAVMGLALLGGLAVVRVSRRRRKAVVA